MPHEEYISVQISTTRQVKTRGWLGNDESIWCVSYHVHMSQHGSWDKSTSPCKLLYNCRQSGRCPSMLWYHWNWIYRWTEDLIGGVPWWKLLTSVCSAQNMHATSPKPGRSEWNNCPNFLWKTANLSFCLFKFCPIGPEGQNFRHLKTIQEGSSPCQNFFKCTECLRHCFRLVWWQWLWKWLNSSFFSNLTSSS